MLLFIKAISSQYAASFFSWPKLESFVAISSNRVRVYICFFTYNQTSCCHCIILKVFLVDSFKNEKFSLLCRVWNRSLLPTLFPQMLGPVFAHSLEVRGREDKWHLAMELWCNKRCGWWRTHWFVLHWLVISKMDENRIFIFQSSYGYMRSCMGWKNLKTPEKVLKVALFWMIRKKKKDITEF